MNFKKAINDHLEEWILVGALILITVLVIMQVFVRFVVDMSIGWTEELARYILIWISWISASYAIQKDAHIKVDFVKNMLNKTGRKSLEFISLLVFFFVALFLLIEGTQLVMNVKLTNQVSPSMGAPMWIIYLIIPIGGFLMGVRLVQKIIEIFRH